jgi:hypothetical protein
LGSAFWTEATRRRKKIAGNNGMTGNWEEARCEEEWVRREESNKEGFDETKHADKGAGRGENILAVLPNLCQLLLQLCYSLPRYVICAFAKIQDMLVSYIRLDHP